MKIVNRVFFKFCVVFNACFIFVQCAQTNIREFRLNNNDLGRA